MRRWLGIYLLALLVLASLAGCSTEDDEAVVTNYAPAVESVSPADGAGGVSVDTSLSVTFDSAMLPSSITADDGSCTGAVQLSANGFDSCVPLTETVQSNDDGTTFTLTPSAALAPATTYQLKVTTAAKSRDGYALKQTYQSEQGFVTSSVAGTASLNVSGVSVGDGQTLYTRHFSIDVAFSAAVDTSSLTSVGSLGACGGTVQLSPDDFANCVPLAFSSVDDQTVSISSTQTPDNGMTLRLKLTTGVTGAAGQALGAEWSHNTGFNIATWTLIDGGNPWGLNYDTAQQVDHSDVVYAAGYTYLTFAEMSSGFWQTRLKRLNMSNIAGGWTYLDGGGTLGLNHNATAHALGQRLAVHNDRVYLAWAESGQIFVGQYDGNVWNRVDGGLSTGLNYDTARTASDPFLTSHNGSLYLTWVEQNGSAINQVRLKRYDGGSTWTFVDGGGLNGLNAQTTLNAYNPVAVSTGTQLFLAWTEQNTARELRIAEWTGSGRTMADGGAGKNFDSAYNAWKLDAAYAGGYIYFAWTEDTAGARQLHLAWMNPAGYSFNALDGGGNTGLNRDSSQSAYDPSLSVRDDSVFIAWSENNGVASQVRVSWANGSYIKDYDGGQLSGLNYYNTSAAIKPKLSAGYQGTTYLTWLEDYPEQVRASMLP